MISKRRALIPSLLSEIEDFRNFFDYDFDNFYELAKAEPASSISVYENDNQVFVKAALPGIKPEDIQITFEKEILWIKGESKKKRGNVKYHMKASEAFSYRIPIPIR